MTFDEYVAYTGTPENLAREAGWWLGTTRHDFSGLLCTRYELCRLSEGQGAAIRWLAALPDGPARLLGISEEWSSGCRRDGPKQTFQTVPTVVFLTKAFEVLYTYFEFPAIYRKTELARRLGVPASRENREKEWERFIRDWGALQESPFWQVWTSAAVDEILSALLERLVVGS